MTNANYAGDFAPGNLGGPILPPLQHPTYTPRDMLEARRDERRRAQDDYIERLFAILGVLKDEASTLDLKAADLKAPSSSQSPGSDSKTVHRAMAASTFISGTLVHRPYWLRPADQRAEPDSPPASHGDGYREACRDHARRLREMMAAIRKL